MTTEVWIDPSGGGASPCQLFVLHDSTVEIKSETFGLRSSETEWILAFLRKYKPATVYVSNDVPGTALFGFNEEFAITRKSWTDLYVRLRQAGYEKDHIGILLMLGESSDRILKEAGISE